MTPDSQGLPAPGAPQVIERTMRIIWIGMVASKLALFGVLYANPALRSDPVAEPSPLDLPLTGIAIVALLASSWLRRYLRSDAQLRKLGRAVSQVPPGSRSARFYALTMTPLVMSLALHQAVALPGFVSAVVHRDAPRMLPFLLVALLLDAIAYPRPARLLERAQQLVPQLSTLLAVLLLSSAGCSFRGGDYTPEKKEPETPCSREAEDICKEKLGSADLHTCIAREKYRCEVVEQEEQQKKDSDKSPAP